MTLVERRSHPHPPAGGRAHHNPVLQWSWPSPSQWLAQGGRRQYAGGWTQVVVSETDILMYNFVFVLLYILMHHSLDFYDSLIQGLKVRVHQPTRHFNLQAQKLMNHSSPMFANWPIQYCIVTVPAM